MPCSMTSESDERKPFWMSRAAACEPMVASDWLRLVIAVSMAFEAVVAAAVDVEMSVDASGDRIAPVSEKSKPSTWKVLDPALETLRPFYGRSVADWFTKVVLGQRSSYRRGMLGRLTPEIAARVHFVGTVRLSELVALYQRADVLVLPSVWNESFGLPIAEAMASAVHVIASRCGGVPELVKEGVTGTLVPRCDVPALVGALRATLADADARRRMGRAARAHAHLRLTWTRSADALEQIYSQLLGERPIVAEEAQVLPFKRRAQLN